LFVDHVGLTILLSFVQVGAFSSTSTTSIHSNQKIRTSCTWSSFTALQAHHHHDDEMSRSAFFSQSMMLLLLSTVPVVPGPISNCVSTANVKQVNNYVPPWTFTVSPEEAIARIKGVVASETFLTLVTEDTYYLLVKAKRGVTAYDQLEFWINPQDSVVTFRSFDVNSTISDFGGNRKRIESIRKKAGVFGIMGEGLTADSFEGRSEINGPMAQLKAFYGLQSGEGFQEIFEE